jgi:hypothetical protein
LKKFFGNRPLRDITPILIEKLKSELRREQNKYKRPHSPATVNRYLQVLSRILSMAGLAYLFRKCSMNFACLHITSYLCAAN